MTDILEAAATLPANALDIAGAGANNDYPQQLLARIEVFEEAIVYTGYEHGRAVRCHEVDARDVASALSGVAFATPFPLPANCLYYARHGGAERLAIYLPPHNRTLTAIVGGERSNYELPLPGLVFWGEGRKYWVRAVDRIPGGSAIVYHAPLPNVGDRGLICRGDVAFPTCSATTIHKAAELFLTSDFSDHLVQERSQTHPASVLTAWTKHARADSYPTDDLVPAHYRPLAAEIAGEN